MAKNLKNIRLAVFRRFLMSVGCEYKSKEGGHEKWRRPGLTRPIVLQTHEEPIPEFVIRKNLQTLTVSREDFIHWLEEND